MMTPNKPSALPARRLRVRQHFIHHCLVSSVAELTKHAMMLELFENAFGLPEVSIQEELTENLNNKNLDKQC